MKRPLFRINALLATLLTGFYLAWWWYLGAPPGKLPLAALTAATLPLVLLLPALWSGNRFGMSLAGFIVPFHFAYAVMELVANPPARAWIAVQTFLSLVLFTCVMAGLRQVDTTTEAVSRESPGQRES